MFALTDTTSAFLGTLIGLLAEGLFRDDLPPPPDALANTVVSIVADSFDAIACVTVDFYNLLAISFVYLIYVRYDSPYWKLAARGQCELDNQLRDVYDMS
jgi:hypothetical protein